MHLAEDDYLAVADSGKFYVIVWIRLFSFYRAASAKPAPQPIFDMLVVLWRGCFWSSFFAFRWIVGGFMGISGHFLPFSAQSPAARRRLSVARSARMGAGRQHLDRVEEVEGASVVVKLVSSEILTEIVCVIFRLAN